jgi:hypothetical protein
MTTGKLNRMRPNWLIAAVGTVFGAALVGGLILTNALAVHGAPFPFELDGNVTDPAGGLDDWQGVFDLTGGNTSPIAGNGETFLRDLPTASTQNKEVQYDAGKDSLDLDSWTRKSVAKVVPDKDNITDAFAKVYMVDVDGAGSAPLHRVIYFGADRFANNGDAALGFWFFQEAVQLTGTNGFSPKHTARTASHRGDILVQADFVSGGSSSEIQIFEWVGTGGNFGGGTLQEIAFGHANGATVCLAGDAACATTNETAGINSFWPYVPKSGSANHFPSESFFEAGIDMTQLFGDICFNTFLANTRTSHSETADLKDMAFGDFNTCGSIDLVRKECKTVTDVSPIYDATTELYQTQHTITVLNDGQGGNVFDVSIRDDAVDANNDIFCNITAISGGSGLPSIPTGGIPIPDNTTFIHVADTLAAGVANQMTVTVLCQAPVNDFANGATVQAGQVDGGTSLTDSYGEGEEDTCHLSLDPALQVTKTCDAVTLDPTNGFAPKVCADISITNTSSPAQKIDVDTFVDTRMDGSTDDLLDEITLVNGKHTLAPGETVNVLNNCYTPTGPDGDQTDPDLARYSDQASAHAVGRASGEAMASSDKATCDLCPTGLDGAAD